MASSCDSNAILCTQHFIIDQLLRGLQHMQRSSTGPSCLRAYLGGLQRIQRSCIRSPQDLHSAYLLRLLYLLHRGYLFRLFQLLPAYSNLKQNNLTNKYSLRSPSLLLPPSPSLHPTLLLSVAGLPGQLLSVACGR